MVLCNPIIVRGLMAVQVPVPEQVPGRSTVCWRELWPTAHTGPAIDCCKSLTMPERRQDNGAMSATTHVSGPGTHRTVKDPALLATRIRLRAVRTVALLGLGYPGQALSSEVDGPVDSITTIEPVKAKWEAFGWTAFDIGGHDVVAVRKALSVAGDAKQPTVLINRTSAIFGPQSVIDAARAVPGRTGQPRPLRRRWPTTASTRPDERG
jgi:hypothetical protein